MRDVSTVDMLVTGDLFVPFLSADYIRLINWQLVNPANIIVWCFVGRLDDGSCIFLHMRPSNKLETLREGQFENYHGVVL